MECKFDLTWWLFVITGSVIGSILYAVVAGTLKKWNDEIKWEEKANREGEERVRTRESARLRQEEKRLACAIKGVESRFQYPPKDGKLVIDDVFWRTVDYHGKPLTVPSAINLSWEDSDKPFFQFSTGNVRTRVTVEIYEDEKEPKRSTDDV